MVLFLPQIEEHGEAERDTSGITAPLLQAHDILDLAIESAMSTSQQLNISEVIDNSRFGSFQLGLCILCGLCLIMDGFDVQAMGYVAPAILKEWHIPNSQFGPVFGAGLFGILVGSLLFSMLADKIGRRPVLIGATLCFSVLTFLTAHAANVNQMLLIRFFAGSVLGAIMPNAVALLGRIQSAPAARDHHDDRGQRVHGWSGFRRVPRGLVDSTLRLAIGLLFGRRRSFDNRSDYDFGAPGVPAISGFAPEASGKGCWLAQADRSNGNPATPAAISSKKPDEKVCPGSICSTKAAPLEQSCCGLSIS